MTRILDSFHNFFADTDGLRHHYLFQLDLLIVAMRHLLRATSPASVHIPGAELPYYVPALKHADLKLQ